jgi:hypothetical protein
MNTTIPTLRDLFVTREVDPKRAPAVPAFVGLAFEGLDDHVFDVLDVNVIDVLVSGWKKHDEVRGQLRATTLDPTRTALVHLAEHTLESTHTPAIEVRAQGRAIATVSFTIEVAFEVGAVELTIRGGAVREIRPGEIKASGTVKLEHSEILKRELAPLRLPGKIVLPGGAAQPQLVTAAS